MSLLSNVPKPNSRSLSPAPVLSPVQATVVELDQFQQPMSIEYVPTGEPYANYYTAPQVYGYTTLAPPSRQIEQYHSVRDPYQWSYPVQHNVIPVGYPTVVEQHPQPVVFDVADGDDEYDHGVPLEIQSPQATQPAFHRTTNFHWRPHRLF